MSDDWQVGDLAVCVDNGPFDCALAPTNLEVGRAYIVTGLVLHPASGTLLLVTDCERVNRAFTHGAPGHWRFRKIRPDKHEDCEPEFVELLKRIKVTA